MLRVSMPSSFSSGYFSMQTELLSNCAFRNGVQTGRCSSNGHFLSHAGYMLVGGREVVMRKETRAKKSRRKRPRVVAFEMPWRSFGPRTRFEKRPLDVDMPGLALRRSRFADEKEERRVRP